VLEPSLPPVYIAGPFAAETHELRLENVRRACRLSRYAVRQGYAPIVVHAGIELGAYGNDNVVPERIRGAAATCVLVEVVAACKTGELWVIERDNGSLSTGTGREWDRWAITRDRYGYRAWNTVRKPWSAWVETMTVPKQTRGVL